MDRRLGMLVALGLAVGAGRACATDSFTSPEHTKCIERSGGVTASMLDCDGAEMQRQDKRLNAAYQKLMKAATDVQKGALRDAQRAWLAFRKGNCDLLYKFGGGGTLDSVAASGCEVDLLAQRVRFLENLSAD